MTQLNRYLAFINKKTFEYLKESDREKTSTLNESIFVEFKLGFDGLEDQKLVFRSFKKRYRCLLLSDNFFKKMRSLESEHRVLSNCKNFGRATTKGSFSALDGDSKTSKTSCDKMQNKLLKNNQ